MDAHSASLFLSAVTVADTEDGIAKLQREGATRKKLALGGVARNRSASLGDRVLAFDAHSAESPAPC
jgi:toxin FitB